MSLQDKLQPAKIYRFVEYLGGAGSDSTIEKTSLEKSCEYDYGYVSRRWIGFERCYGVITSTGGHAEIHDDQIGTGRSCLLYGMKPGRCFNRFVAGFSEAEHQQFSNGGIVIDDENLAFDRFGTVTHGPHFKNLSILINQFRWPAFLVVPPLISFCGIELDRRAESGTRGLI